VWIAAVVETDDRRSEAIDMLVRTELPRDPRAALGTVMECENGPSPW